MQRCIQTLPKTRNENTYEMRQFFNLKSLHSRRALASCSHVRISFGCFLNRYKMIPERKATDTKLIYPWIYAHPERRREPLRRCEGVREFHQGSVPNMPSDEITEQTVLPDLLVCKKIRLNIDRTFCFALPILPRLLLLQFVATQHIALLCFGVDTHPNFH